MESAFLVEIDPGAGSAVACRLVGDCRGSQVLDRQAKRLEDRDLRGILTSVAWCEPGQQVADLGADVPGPDRAISGREQGVAGFVRPDLAPLRDHTTPGTLSD